MCLGFLGRYTLIYFFPVLFQCRFAWNSLKNIKHRKSLFESCLFHHGSGVVWIGQSRTGLDKRLCLRWIMSVCEWQWGHDMSNKCRSAGDGLVDWQSAHSSVWLTCLVKWRSFPTCAFGITDVWPGAIPLAAETIKPKVTLWLHCLSQQQRDDVQWISCIFKWLWTSVWM